jgi:choice-of-anchor B domain-containing protein
MGPPFQQRARLAARGFTLLQDPKAETIETMIARSQVAPIAAPAAPAICTGGMAGPYPCLAVDFLSQIPLNEFSSNPSAANDIWGFVDLNDDREYAIIGLRNGTAVVDVSDPQNPTEVGTIPGLASIWRDIKVLQTFDAIQSEWQAYAYVTVDAAAQGLQIIDLTDLPASISLAGTYHGIASAHNIYIANIDYASGAALPGLEPFIYILGSDRDNGAFRILDVSDPIVPVEVTAPPQGTGYVHDAASLVISDARVSACRPGHRPCELLIDYNETTVDLWDVTDKTEPFLISSTPYAGAAYTHSGWATGDGTHVFIQDELDEQNQGVNTTLRTLDIADLSTPFVSNVWIGTTTSIDHNGFVKDQRYYMSNYRRGLTILDINNPNDPQEVAFFDTFPNPADNSARFEGAWGTYPFLPSGTLLVSDIQSGLFVLREQLVPPPAVTASLGYAWADQPAAAIYEPSPTYAFNSAGGPITVNRQGTGRYSVRFAGLGGQGTVGGNVEVTPYGTDLVRCKVDGWNSGSADFIANVVCFDPAGTAADARYTVLVRWPDRG